MELVAGSIVKRVHKDNYPECKVGDVGVVCYPNTETRRMFGDMSKYPIEMVLVSFKGKRPCPNIVEYLELIF